MFELIQGDCLEKIKTVSDKSIDMILTDPPYEISNSGGGMMNRDNRNFIREIDAMEMCKSAFQPQIFLSLCLPKFKHNNYFCGVFFCSIKQLSKYLNWAKTNKMQYGVGIYYKSNPPPLCNNKYLNDVEYWVYIKGNKSRILGNYSSKSLVYSSTINKKDKLKYSHPTIKPLPLIKKFIINHTLEKAIVLDPFMGSGTTGEACINLRRRFIGIELDKKYFEIAEIRILNAYSGGLLD